MADYKVRYKDNTGEHVTDFLPHTIASRMFNKRLNETVLVTEWCDLENWGDPCDDGDVTVEKRFTRRITTVMGHRIVTPFFINLMGVKV